MASPGTPGRGLTRSHMMPWQILLIAALAIDFAIHVATDLLNLRALRPEVPGDFRDLYDADRYRLTQAYTRERTRFGLIASSVRLALLLAFWLGGGFGLVDHWTRALAWPEVPTGLAFVAVLLLGPGLLRLPFAWYATFALEEKYGFNRATPRTFWTDVATGVGLAVALGGPLLAAILWLFGSAGPRAWLWCWVLVTAWTVGVQYVAPTWIMPLFNRFTNLPAGPLRDALLGVAEHVGFPLAGVWVIDGSKRSTKANAFFTGFGSRKRIALFDTLLATLAPDEVVAVVAHEIGHYKRRHVQWGLAIAVVHTGVLLFLLSLVLQAPSLFAAFGIDQPSVHAGLVVFGILMTPLELPTSLALNALSRRHEYAADRFATDAVGTGRDLAHGLRRLAADTLTNLTPHPWYVALHHSHPPVVERVRVLESNPPPLSDPSFASAFRDTSRSRIAARSRR
jgi:STE24 endopeptidase